MRRKNIQIFLLLGVLALTGLSACGEDRWPAYYKWTGRALWIDSIMREEYLWAEEIPGEEELNYFLEPDAFLTKIISPLDKGYSTVDTLYATPLPSYGFDYTLYGIADNDTAYNALVTYVLPHSPAAEAGLQRGEWIMKINDDFITENTEKSLSEGGALKLLIGKYSTLETETGEAGIIISSHTANLTAARPVEDVTIPSYGIPADGVGYLAYNSFSTEADSELLRLSLFYKENNVKDLILDLRYNAGGETDCVQLLATLLAPADKLGSTLASLQHNPRQMSKDRELTLDAQLLQSGTNLNLSRLYILTSNTTAGASEMLINCLKPHMTVILVGAATKGENVATASFPSDKFQWVLRPVVCEVFNAEGKADYSAGFTPDYTVTPLQNPAKVLPLGNPDEELLSAALGLIDGSIVLPEPEPEPEQEPETPMKAVKSVQVKRTFRNGLIIQ